MDIKRSISIDDDVALQMDKFVNKENSNFSAMMENAAVFLLSNLDLYFKQKADIYSQNRDKTKLDYNEKG